MRVSRIFAPKREKAIPARNADLGDRVARIYLLKAMEYEGLAAREAQERLKARYLERAKSYRKLASTRKERAGSDSLYMAWDSSFC